MSDALTADGLLTISATLPAISIVAVGLRFYTRRWQSVPVKIDDWFMIPALAFYIGMGIINIYGVKVDGYGTPAPKATKGGTKGSGVGPTAFVFFLLQVVMFGLTKLGALLFYRRVFCLQQPFDIMHGIILGLLAIVSMWTISFLVAGATNCGTHPWASWTGSANYFKYCVNAFPVTEGFAISDFLLDVIIIIVPLPKIWALHMSVARKLCLSLIFLSALVSLAAAITRMVEVTQVLRTGKQGSTADPRLEDTEVAFWGMLEGGLALIAVNLPSLWPLAQRAPESVVHSVRSLVSLRSLDAKNSKSSLKGSADKQSSSQTELNGNEREAKFETYAMRDVDIEANEHGHPANSKDIRVQQEISQKDENVRA